MGNFNPFGSGSSSSSNTGSGNQTGNALSGLSDAFSALSPDTSGMSGFDVGSLFTGLDPTTFNEDTASIQATQAITPPAQAQANAATGQDPSAGVGGTQTGTQTASTGPNQPNQPSQEQQDQEQRNKAIDEIKRILRQRLKQQQEPPQWNPRYASAADLPSSNAQEMMLRNLGAEGAGGQSEYGFNIPPGGEGESNQPEYGPGYERGKWNPYPEGESNQPEYGPGTPGAPYPEGTDYQTEYGHELNLPRPGAPALPDPSGSTGRQITVRPRAPLPARTVPGTPGAPAGTPDITFKPGEPIPTGGDGIPGLPGLGPILRTIGLGAAEGPLIGLGAVPLSATPAETGEFTPAEPNFVRPDAPVGTHGLPGSKDPPAAPPPPPAPAAKRKDQPKPKPKAAEPPRRVWVPPTPGHYIPTPGLGRGQPTWVDGTPGHYVEGPATGHRSRPEAVSRSAGTPTPKTAEAALAHTKGVSPPPGIRAPKTPEDVQRLSEARAEAPEVMAYNQDARLSPMLRDILGIAMPQLLPSLARQAGSRPNSPSNVYGQGGTRPYNENWGGAAYVAKGDEIQRGRQYMGYLTNKGLTRQGAAALLGNAHQESNLSATLAPGGDGGTAAGMFQWRGPRQVAFRRWLQANGRSESDPQAHLDFALFEMQTNPAYRASWEALHNPNMSPAQIADIIANNYEGSKRGPTQGMNNRIGFANSMLQGGGTGTTVPMPIQASGGDAQG